MKCEIIFQFSKQVLQICTDRFEISLIFSEKINEHHSPSLEVGLPGSQTGCGDGNLCRVEPRGL